MPIRQKHADSAFFPFLPYVYQAAEAWGGGSVKIHLISHICSFKAHFPLYSRQIHLKTPKGTDYLWKNDFSFFTLFT